MPTWYLPCLLLISVLNSWSCLHYLLIVENKGSTAEGFRPKVESSEGENGTTSRTLITHRISHIIPSGPSLVWLLLSVLISASILFWCWGNLHICGNACGKCNFLYHVNPLLLQKIHKHFHKRDFFLTWKHKINTLAFLRCDEGTTKLQKKDHHPWQSWSFKSISMKYGFLNTVKSECHLPDSHIWISILHKYLEQDVLTSNLS